MIKSTLWLSLLCLPLAAVAQVPVDDDGRLIGDYETGYDNAPADERRYSTATGNEGIPLLSDTELEDLIGPIALYPDDLLAIVLPAATYPLQLVEAARFLDALEDDPSLSPDEDWDDSIVALINYPEVVELLNEDLDWTWQLGEAVVAQQADVVNAVERFRNRAYAAGNLRSDEYQTVHEDDGVIEIRPISEEVIYVPYYEPAEVVVYQPRRVYYYYPDPCPVYYYPYPSRYDFYRGFNRGYFWGVTTAFTIGWQYDHLRVFHHSYRGHPYYGRRYWNRWWYRRPSLHVHNNIYIGGQRNYNRYSQGDSWRPSRSTRLRHSDRRIAYRTDRQQRDQITTARHSDSASGTRRTSMRHRDRAVDAERDVASRFQQRRDGRVGTRASGDRQPHTTQRAPVTRRGTATSRRDAAGNPPAIGRQRAAERDERPARQRPTTVRRSGATTYTRNEPRATARQRPASRESRPAQQRPATVRRSAGPGYSRNEPRATPRQRPASVERPPARRSPPASSRSSRSNSDGSNRQSESNRPNRRDESRRRRR